MMARVVAGFSMQAAEARLSRWPGNMTTPIHTAARCQIDLRRPSVLAGRRIAMVLGALGLGGAERQAIHLADYLRKRTGADVEVWGTEYGRASDLCADLAIPVRIVDLPWSYGARLRRMAQAARFVRTVRQRRVEVLLPYTMWPNIVCGLTWRAGGARLCVWNQRDEGRGLRDGWVHRWAIARTPLFISNSAHGAEVLAARFGVSSSVTFVIRNGVEMPSPVQDRDAWRRRLDVPQRAFVACMVANLHDAKDHATLLTAWRTVVDRLANNGVSPVLMLAGRFDAATAPLKALAYDLNLGRSVRFLGPISDIAGLLGAVDIGVFSSRLEGVPNGVLECMASGLAVVATDIPGCREALGPSAERWLVRPGDATSLGDKIVTLAVDPCLRGGLGAANQRRIKAEFTLGRMCEQTAQVLSSHLR